MTKGICCISFSFFLITILLLCTKRSDADSNEFLLFTNKPPKNTTVELGGSHSFTCTSNKDGVFTKWYKNIDLEKIFEPYFDLDDYKLESQGNNKSTLKLRNISHDDQGWYSCLMEAITDNEMRINASFYLTVKDPNRNLNNDLTNTIVKILETFDDASLKNALASWNYYEYEPDVRGEVNNHQDELTTYRFLYIVKYETSDLRSDNITCIFHDSLQVNTFQYKKIKARGSFTYKSSNGSISRKGFFEVHIMNADISTKLIIRNTPQMGLDCNTSMTHEEITTVFWFMDDYRLKRKIRVDLGTQLSNSLITMVNNLIGNLIKISIRPMLSICKEPLQIIKMSLPEFDKQLLENLYYFAIDRGWIDIPKLVNRSQVVDVLVQGLSNIKSIHVSYPDWINGDIVHELRMENLKGNLIWVQYSTELTELSFEIDFILLTVKKTKNKINEVRIKAGTFSVVPVTSNVSSLTGNQNAHIKEEFELLAADFLYEKISGDFTTRFKNTNSTENTSLQQSQFYLFDDRNIGESLARAIAKILQSFHKDAMQSIKKYANKKIKNQEHFSQLEISATIFNVQEEICDFTNLIKVKYDDVWIELKGIILGSNNSKSHDREFENIPFVVNINSLAISRQRNSAECLANIDGNDKTTLMVFSHRMSLSMQSCQWLNRQDNDINDCLIPYLKQ